MDQFSVEIGIWTSNGACLRSFHLKVDAAAPYSRLPASILYNLGWTPTQPPRPTRLPDGAPTTVALGEVKMRYNGEDLTRLFVFGADDCAPLLGNDALQGFGIAVDPINHRLIPAEAHR